MKHNRPLSEGLKKFFADTEAKTQQLTAENERLREDVKTRIKNQAELAVKTVNLKKENDKLREVYAILAFRYSVVASKDYEHQKAIEKRWRNIIKRINP